MTCRAYLDGIDTRDTVQMSKQLAISAAASVFAMVAALLAMTPARDETGAPAIASAPVAVEAVAGLPSIIR